MHITVEEFTTTEELLTRYFEMMKKLSVWKTNAIIGRERIKWLESRLESGILVQFADNVRSATFSNARPSNRQPPKGIDAAIDRAAVVYDNLLEEKSMVEIDIITTEAEIGKLERDTLHMAEIMKAIGKEAVRILELKLLEGKSFEEIGEKICRSKSAVYDFYKKTITDIYKRLEYMGSLTT